MQSGKTSSDQCTPTQQRLLEAAARLFARDGLDGATTREIAREAGVNEVTLFRLFGSKENLLSAVVGRTFDNEQNRTKLSLPEATGDLRKDLENYVQVYEALLTENLPLVRTLIGEIHRHADQEKKVVDGIFRPLRAELINWLKQAAARGQLREDVDPAVTADLLGGMVFTGVLRRASPNKPIEYTPADYLKTCVDVLARGIERDNNVQ